MRKLIVIVFAILGFQTVKSLTYEPPKHPVVLVPGFGGSILFRNRNMIWATTSPNTDCRYLLDLNDSSITTTNYRFGLEAIDEIGTNGLFSGVPYFTEIINRFKSIGYTEGVDLFGFPYDWRQSPDDPAILMKFHQLVDRINPVVIAHSMGGLLVESYHRVNPHNKIRRVINVSVPFKGAAGNALKAFLSGYNLGNTYLTNTDLMKRLAKEFYSSYWLLPQPNLLPTPKIVSEPAVQYLLPHMNFYPQRYRVRPPVNIITQMYYLTTNQTRTPYDYDHITDYFSYVPGDGTVPQSSSLHALEHGQPLENNILIDSQQSHMDLLKSRNVIDKIMVLSGNVCRMAGYYKHQNTIIYLRVPGYSGNHTYYFSVRLEQAQIISCTEIKVEGIAYSRLINEDCSGAIVYEHIEAPDYEYKKECLYGHVFEYRWNWCSPGTCQRDYIKDITTMISPPIDPPQSPPNAQTTTPSKSMFESPETLKGEIRKIGTLEIIGLCVYLGVCHVIIIIGGVIWWRSRRVKEDLYNEVDQSL